MFAYLYKLTNQLTLNGADLTEMTKACTVTFMKARKYLVIRCGEKRVISKKNAENICFKALANRFWLTSKLISCVKEQQNCLWTTFY